MRRENLGNAIGVVIIIALLLFAFWLAPFALQQYGGLLVATLLFALLFLPEFRLKRVGAPPEAVLARLSYELRLAGHRVVERPNELTIRVGTVAALKLRARSAGGRTVVGSQADATPSGWGTLLTIMVFSVLFPPWTAILPAIAFPYVFVRERSFITRHITPLLTAEGRLREGPPADDVRAMLLNSLAEGHRIAAEAYEAQRTAYHDSQGVVATGAILAGVALFVGFMLVLPGPSFVSRVPWSFGLAMCGALGLAFPSAWLIRRRFRGRALGLKAWADRLRDALSREVAHRPLEATEPGALEILVEASKEVPEWLQASRKAGLSGDPVNSFLLFVMGSQAVVAFFAVAWMAATGQWLLAILFALAGLGLGSGSYLFYGRWKRERDAEATRILSEWNERFERVRSQMERYLEGL